MRYPITARWSGGWSQDHNHYTTQPHTTHPLPALILIPSPIRIYPNIIFPMVLEVEINFSKVIGWQIYV